MPESFNTIEPLVKEWFRNNGINPRELKKPLPVRDQMLMSLQRAGLGGNNMIGNELSGEMADEQSGSQAQITTPIGQVPTSPLPASSLIQ